MNQVIAAIPRFWRKVRRGPKCWEWTGGTTDFGYGQIRCGGKIVYSHRFSYLINRGPIPVGLSVLHKCDNPRCVRPDHLFLGTVLDNNADMKRKGRSPSGKKHYNYKHGRRAKRA